MDAGNNEAYDGVGMSTATTAQQEYSVFVRLIRVGLKESFIPNTQLKWNGADVLPAQPRRLYMDGRDVSYQFENLI